MSTTWSKFAEQDIAKPTVSDEQQELVYDGHHKVLLTDCTFTITTDELGAFVGNKVQGHGFHVSNNGDMYAICGSKRQGGGFYNLVSRGGQIVKTGPVVVERSKSRTHPSKDKDFCYSETNIGDWTNETKGHINITGLTTKISAQDSLILECGQSQITMTSGDIKISSPGYKLTTDLMYETVFGRRQIISSEDVKYQYDPRASNNIVSAGHIRYGIGGDLDLDIGANARMYVWNLPPIGIGIPGINRAFSLDAKFLGNVSVNAILGAIDMKTLTAFNVDAGGASLIKTGGLTQIASGGNLGITSPMGVGIVAGLPDMPSFIPGKFTAKGTLGVEIVSDTSMKIEAGTELDLRAGLMIYLN